MSADTTPAAPPKDPNAEYPDRAAYLGLRWGQKSGEVYAVFYWLTPAELSGDARIPTSPEGSARCALYPESMPRQLKGCVPGAIFPAKRADDGAIAYRKGARPLDYVADTIRRHWDGVHRGVKAARDADAAREKEWSRNMLREHVEPLRRMYDHSRGAARAQLLALIVAEITRK